MSGCRGCGIDVENTIAGRGLLDDGTGLRSPHDLHVQIDRRRSAARRGNVHDVERLRQVVSAIGKRDDVCSAVEVPLLAVLSHARIASAKLIFPSCARAGDEVGNAAGIAVHRVTGGVHGDGPIKQPPVLEYARHEAGNCANGWLPLRRARVPKTWLVLCDAFPRYLPRDFADIWQPPPDTKLCSLEFLETPIQQSQLRLVTVASEVKHLREDFSFAGRKSFLGDWIERLWAGLAARREPD